MLDVVLQRGCYHGLNFVGTKNALRQLQMNLTKMFGKESTPNAADEIGITWTMIPPGAPHFGGLRESGAKLSKSHLRRVAGNNVLTTRNFLLYYGTLKQP